MLDAETIFSSFPTLHPIQIALLNPMTASGSLFECLFEVVDCGGQHELAELAVPCARVDSGAESTLDGRKGGLGHPALVV